MPDSFHVSGNSLLATTESDEAVSDDPRGLVLLYEEPLSQAKYIMGMDPTEGITGWSRAIRTEGDRKIDNAAIEVFRIDAFKRPLFLPDGKPDIDPNTKTQRFVMVDKQVCEFAAPIDAVESARVANLLGRIFAGEEQDQCEFIYEAYPGPGMLSTQELLRLGYANVWMWEYIDSVVEQTNRMGWRSTRETQRLLWLKARRHLMQRRVLVQSPYLKAEYDNAVVDIQLARARAAYSYHDDRIQAASMCYWAGHRWTYDVDRTDIPVTETAVVDWQHTAPVLGEYRSVRDAWADVVDGWD